MALDPLLPFSKGECGFPLSFTPDFEVVQVNDNGLVVRCSRSFEWGSTLQLGAVLHIQVPASTFTESAGESCCESCGDARIGDSVLDFKGIVVDCHEVISYPAANPQYEITLFYDSITEEECEALLRASRQRLELETPEFTLQNLENLGGFDRICGLN
ncbi:MAG: hypothetical protein O3C21_20130 [Verrucomicrobia bacterium]|nr:hypothetical protein [Verrucomicrobiota bacterium]